jgi:hypothetical protein
MSHLHKLCSPPFSFALLYAPNPDRNDPPVSPSMGKKEFLTPVKKHKKEKMLCTTTQ